VAVVLLDQAGNERSAVNNNSICTKLYHSAEFGPRCAEYCGRAFSAAFDAGSTIGYKCHAGLVCRAVPLRQGPEKLVAISGRAFIQAEDYRSATERAVAGDWRGFTPGELFENVLLTASAEKIDKAVAKLEALAADEQGDLVNATVALAEKKSPQTKERIESAVVDETRTQTQERDPGPHRDEIRNWRSIFGSILELDYHRASASIVNFIASRDGLTSLMWLERRGDKLEFVCGRGTLSDASAKIAVPADDERVVRAAADGAVLELSAKPQKEKNEKRRKLAILPVLIGKKVAAALAFESESPDDAKVREIARLCQSVAPQLEILRLRREMEKKTAIDDAVRRFTDALRHSHGSNFWMQLIQSSAEMLQAERASLLVRRERAAGLKAVATVGVRADLSNDREIGRRVSLGTLEKGRPLLVKDIAVTALADADRSRRYKTPSFISFPISTGSSGVAVMNFADKAGNGVFDEMDLELLNAVAPQVAVALDRAALKEQAGTYAQLSVTDALTGLLNRRYIEARLTEEIRRSNRHGFPMSFMLLDVDEFKSYNDRFGHPAGDEALKLVGQILKETVRGADVAARYGGEEFAVLLPQTTGDEAEVIAERVRQRIEQATFQNRRVTVSIGIGTCSASINSMRALIDAADKALYAAKRNGRNNVQSYGNIGTDIENVH
jgi:diguanylate cyclase (GGDEF)-like protein